MPEVQHCSYSTIEPHHKESNLGTFNELRSLLFLPALHSLTVKENKNSSCQSSDALRQRV